MYAIRSYYAPDLDVGLAHHRARRAVVGQLRDEPVAFGDLIVSILEREPDLDALPVATPPHVRRLLLRALTKDPRQRLRNNFV